MAQTASANTAASTSSRGESGLDDLRRRADDLELDLIECLMPLEGRAWNGCPRQFKAGEWRRNSRSTLVRA